MLAALKRDGHYENTLIFLFSDHGYKLHRHKQYLYEGGIHMPLIVAGPGIKGGQVTQQLVSSIDVSAATVAASGTPVPDYMEGQDFLSPNHTPRSYVISARDRCDYTIEHIRAVVTPKYKYLRNYLTDRPFMQPSYKDPWPVSKEFRRLMTEGKMNKATPEGKKNHGWKRKEIAEAAQSYSICFGADVQKGNKGIILLTRNHGGNWNSGYEYKYLGDNLKYGGRTARRKTMVNIEKANGWLDPEKVPIERMRDVVLGLRANEGQMAFCDGRAIIANDEEFKDAIKEHKKTEAGLLKTPNFNTSRPRH